MDAGLSVIEGCAGARCSSAGGCGAVGCVGAAGGLMVSGVELAGGAVGLGCGAGGWGAVFTGAFAPHFTQNFCVSLSCAPHFVQNIPVTSWAKLAVSSSLRANSACRQSGR